MKRAVLFGLLGPAVSVCLLFFASLPLGGVKDPAFAIPFLFVVQIVPLLLCGLFDFLLEDIPFWERLMVMAIAGACLACAGVAVVVPWLFYKDAFAVVMSLCGSISALTCTTVQAKCLSVCDSGRPCSDRS